VSFVPLAAALIARFQEIEDIFVSIGFSVVEGPEIETPYLQFRSVEYSGVSSGRDDMDTFYLELPKVRRPAAAAYPTLSPVQIRTMESGNLRCG